MFTDEHNFQQLVTNNPMTQFANSKIKDCENLLSCVEEIKKRLVQFKWPLSEIKREPSFYMRQIDKYCKQNDITGEELFNRCENFVQEMH